MDGGTSGTKMEGRWQAAWAEVGTVQAWGWACVRLTRAEKMC